jgi:broad specificity phosphatase PhoE
VATLIVLLGLIFESLGPVSPDAVRLILVRHGQAFLNLVPPPLLPKDKLDHLTPIGIAQVIALGHAFDGLSPAIIFSSPAVRARETSGVLIHAMGKERDVSIAPALAPLASTNPLLLDECGRRMEAFARQLLTTYAGKSVLLVAHAEVIAAFLGAVEGLPPEKRWPRALDNASVTVIDFGKRPHVRLVGWKADEKDSQRAGQKTK